MASCPIYENRDEAFPDELKKAQPDLSVVPTNKDECCYVPSNPRVGIDASPLIVQPGRREKLRGRLVTPGPL